MEIHLAAADDDVEYIIRVCGRVRHARKARGQFCSYSVPMPPMGVEFNLAETRRILSLPVA